MKWILILYWSLNGQDVLTHEVFLTHAPCEERIVALKKVFDYLGHTQWQAQCQPEKDA